MEIIKWLLFLVFTISITSCQPQPAVPSQGPAPNPAASFSTTSPTLAPTFTLLAEDNPTPSDASQPTGTLAAVCQVGKGIPFAFMPDNRHLLMRRDTNILDVDLQTRQSEEFLPVQFEPGLLITAVSLSPSGDQLALALTDYTIQVYQTADKKLRHTLTGHTGIVTELEFTQDGEKLYSASHDKWVRVWDRDGNQVGAFQPTDADNYPDEVLGMGLSLDDQMLAIIPFDGKTKIWDAEKFTLVREMGAYGGYDLSDAVFSPDGQYLAATTANGLFLWKVSDSTQIMGGNPGINAMALAFSPDGRFLAYWDVQGDNEITLLSADGTNNIRTFPTDGMPVWTIIFSPDSSLLSAGSEKELHIWHVEDGELLITGKDLCP